MFVKDGIVTWELQATDYPQLEEGLPPYEPRGCQRGISYSWYLYSPIRVKYPYARGVLIDMYRQAKREALGDPVDAWAAIQENPEWRKTYQEARGKGGFRRISWDEATRDGRGLDHPHHQEHGPDRVAGFSPIPAMSQISYAAGSRFMSLIGGAVMSFYDWYCDLPPASPETWGEQTDVHESADWYNARFIAVMGANLNMTRTPDTHFISEVRHAGAKLTVFSPDFSQVAKYADWWIPTNPGQDTAFWLAVNHVLLTEFYRRPQGRLLRVLRPSVHRPAAAGAGGRRQGRPVPACLGGRALQRGRERRLEDAHVGRRGRRAPHAQRLHRRPLGRARTRVTGTWSSFDSLLGTRDLPGAELHRPPRRRGRGRAGVLRRRRAHHAVGSRAHRRRPPTVRCRSPPCSIS